MKAINIWDTSKHGSQYHISDEELEQRTHELETCDQCHYVLCSCGRCHSIECNQICSYETGYKSDKDMRS